MRKILDFFRKIKTGILLWFGKILGTGKNTEKTWRKMRPWTIYIISFLLVITVFAVGISTVLHKMFGPADKHDSSPVLFTVNSGASLSSVASSLKERGLIKTSFGIKLLADFTSVSSKIQSGEYVLDRTMSAQDILDTITKPTASSKIISVTIIEGMRLETIADTLQATGVIESADEFLQLCNDVDAFPDYEFLQPLKEKTGLKYLMEGYLFPDTYQFYADTDPKVCINRMLARMNTIYSDEYKKQAEKMGMSMHDVLTLASIAEKEGRDGDFDKISAVIHNRLTKGMKLESDVTVQYALNISKLNLDSTQLAVDSPYNTYLVTGLPAGPICSPSKKAIEAALFPNEEVVKGGYLYFLLTDPYTGEVAYSKTYEEHLRLKNKYKALWDAYDREHSKQ